MITPASAAKINSALRKCGSTGRRDGQSLYARAMKRLFLAVMALLAGFAAQVAPTVARANVDTQIGAAANAGMVDRQAAVRAATNAPRPEQPFARVTKASSPVRAVSAPMLATVLIGIDRARE